MEAIELIAIILSLVALFVTVIGFFASLKFYRDGTQMQIQAGNVLTKIDARAMMIQSQVGGMFDKTLDAALRTTTSEEAQKQQSRLLDKPKKESKKGATVSSASETATNLMQVSEFVHKITSYYGFKQLRMSDVTDATARSLFNFGSSGGFRLFDGKENIVYFGGFLEVEPSEVVASTRILFSNIDIAERKIVESLDLKIRDQVTALLNQISVEVLVGVEIDVTSLKQKIEEFQLQARNIPVTILKMADIEEGLEAEHRRMEP